MNAPVEPFAAELLNKAAAYAYALNRQRELIESPDSTREGRQIVADTLDGLEQQLHDMGFRVRDLIEALDGGSWAVQAWVRDHAREPS
jgi:hypothetical protein